MKLSMAARRFDKTKVYDGYDGTYLFSGQVLPHDYMKLDGAAVQRRALVVAPDCVMPARRTIQLGGNKYIVGDPTTDQWNNKSIRTQYVINQADGIAVVKSVSEFLSDAPGISAHATRTWNKDMSDSSESSDFFNDYHIFFSYSEPVPDRSLIFIDDEWHFCHSSHKSLAGFRDATCYEVEGDFVELAAIAGRTYNPVSDTFSQISGTAKLLRIRWRQYFEYLSEAQSDYQRGDESAFVLKSQWPGVKPSDTVTLSDGEWVVLSVRDYDSDVFYLQIRRA